MAAVLLDMRKAFDLLSRRYLRCVLRIVCGQEPDVHSTDTANDCDAVTWVLLLLGSENCVHERVVEVNSQLTRPVRLNGGLPQGLSPCPLFYTLAGEGLTGLLTTIGVEGISVPVSSTRTVHFNSTKFADDFAGYIVCHA